MRAHPIVITTWHGTATVELIDRYYQWFDTLVAASLAAEQRVVRISDLSQARCPSARACKRAYEHVRSDVASEVTLASFVAVDDPLLRSVIGAVRWVSGGRRDPELYVVDSVTLAIEQGLARLRAERIPAPAGLDPAAYEPPRLASTLI